MVYDVVFLYQGETGSPLVYTKDGRVWLEGLMSMSGNNDNINNNNKEVCQPSTRPSVLTKVGHFTEWIQAVTNILN